MMCYDFVCDECRIIYEDVMQEPNEPHELTCAECGKKCRRLYSVPSLNFDKGSYGYFDIGMGTFIKNPTHRKEEMEKRGLTVYESDPRITAAHAESRYIRGQSQSQEAKTAAHKVMNEAGKKVKEDRLRRIYRNSPIREKVLKVQRETLADVPL